MANHASSSSSPPLSSLADWTRRHICEVFESPTNELTLLALDSTFSRGLKATVNGDAVDFDGFSMLIASMAEHAAPTGPKVEWVFADETPDDAGHRNGVVKGEYFIRDIFGKIPGTDQLIEIETRKQVVGRIESQTSEAGIDSRRIVRLDATVSVEPVNRSNAPP
ncbi:hypothetical protein B0H16DRAFT_1537391 [Mycena metata]|uniref:Uncharacterized protein n=1 Tax=Mycena metata TaxID=1033252 RepID=A0AAD7NF67_9AGAR|nr:hypothetical protein B0H16DRAFT_1537391 [Mycena metata]